jgi:hypothetical protein
VHTASAVAAERLDDADDPERRPSVSASGFSWLTARTRCAPRSRSTTASGTASSTAAGRRSPCALARAPCGRGRAAGPLAPRRGAGG